MAMEAVTAIIVIGGLTLILASLLFLADKWLRVYEDPRIDLLENMLPHTNCGACGYPGCRAFAEALVQEQAPPGRCTVSSAEGLLHIANYLGVPVGEEEKRVARLACAGGSNVARNRAHYTGMATCQAATQVSGGAKDCAWGCLGFGDCEAVCDFDAIHMNLHDLPVVDEDKCTACGDCVVACPKSLFSLHPISHRLWVACSSQAQGDVILEGCEVACTACGRCAMDAPAGLIAMQNNLPVIDYSGNHQTRIPIERCPTGAIAWIEPDGHIVKGAASPKIIRQQPRRSATT